jgi:hypothetical protein
MTSPFSLAWFYHAALAVRKQIGRSCTIKDVLTPIVEQVAKKPQAIDGVR